MSSFATPLPIDDALPELTAALGASNVAVLVAPPGAGKTTRVPLALIDEPWTKGGNIKLLVMSATIDGARVAKLLGDAPVVESEGRAHPVETRYLGRDPQRPIEAQVTDAVARALRAEDGSILVFLPGAAEIRRCETQL